MTYKYSNSKHEEGRKYELIRFSAVC